MACLFCAVLSILLKKFIFFLNTDDHSWLIIWWPDEFWLSHVWCNWCVYISCQYMYIHIHNASLHIKVQYQLLNYTSKPFFLVLQKTPLGSCLDVRFSHEDIVQSCRCRWCETYALIMEHIEECSVCVNWALCITSSQVGFTVLDTIQLKINIVKHHCDNTSFSRRS